MIDQCRDGVGQDGRGVGEQAAPIAGMMAAFAQIDVEMDSDAAAAAEEDRGPIRRQPRAVGGEQQVGLQFVVQRLADLRADPASRSPRRSR